MYEHREGVTHAHPATASEQVETVAEDPYAHRRGTADKIQQLIYLVFGVISALLAIRFSLRLLGANPDAPFASFVYGVTAGFLAPFFGLWRPLAFDGSVIEWHSLVAIVVYLLLGWVLARLAWLVMGETRRAARTYSGRVDTEIR